MKREYKRRKLGENHTITFTPNPKQSKKMGEDCRKKECSMSSLIRTILNKHYNIEG